MEEADNGIHALEALQASKFDFVVSDVNMPAMNGFESLKSIKADSSLMELPVLTITVDARKEDFLLAAQSGAPGYVVKPFTRAVLEDKVRKIVQRLPSSV